MQDPSPSRVSSAGCVAVGWGVMGLAVWTGRLLPPKQSTRWTPQTVITGPFLTSEAKMRAMGIVWSSRKSTACRSGGVPGGSTACKVGEHVSRGRAACQELVQRAEMQWLAALVHRIGRT